MYSAVRFYHNVVEDAFTNVFMYLRLYAAWANAAVLRGSKHRRPELLA